GATRSGCSGAHQPRSFAERAGKTGRAAVTRAGCNRIGSVCVAVLAWRSGRRGAKVDAGTSAERRNEPCARENATRMGRTLFARGFVTGLARITRYGLRPAPARDAKIAPAQTIQSGHNLLYVTAIGRREVVVRAFVKKTQKTPRSEIELALQRAKEII